MSALLSLVVLASLVVGVAMTYAALPRGSTLRRQPGRGRLGLAQIGCGGLWLLWATLALAGIGHERVGAGWLALLLGVLWCVQGTRRLR